MVGISIVNFGDPADTVELLYSISRISTENYKIIVVDNRTNQNNLDNLKIAFLNLDSRFLLIESESNLGFSGGNNLAIEHFLKCEQIDHIWLLNNDTQISEETLMKALEYIELYPYDILGSTILYSDTLLSQCLGGYKFNPVLLLGKPIFKGMDIKEILLLDEESVSRQIDYISGASMILPSEFFRKYGCMDTKYFLYYEEMDISMKFKGKGRLRWCKDLIVLHKEGATINGGPYSKARSKVAEYHSLKSSIIFARKWYGGKAGAVIWIRILSKVLSNVVFWRTELLKINYKAIIDSYKVKHE